MEFGYFLAPVRSVRFWGMLLAMGTQAKKRERASRTPEAFEFPFGAPGFHVCDCDMALLNWITEVDGDFMEIAKDKRKSIFVSALRD